MDPHCCVLDNGPFAVTTAEQLIVEDVAVRKEEASTYDHEGSDA